MTDTTSRGYLDIHILQTLPANNINRGFDGAPKTVELGGTTRQRVSSQAWKRAVREHWSLQNGVRTRRIVQLLQERLNALGFDPKKSQEAAIGTLAAAGFSSKKNLKEAAKDEGSQKTQLMFLSEAQLDQLADLTMNPPQTAKKEELPKVLRSVLGTDKTPDIALFGSMMTGENNAIASYSTTGAAQVAHAIGIGVSEVESDFFSALDDADSNGAGMIGTRFFTASTLYRYANINLHVLRENLGESGHDLGEVVSEFVRSFAESMPGGSQNSYGNTTLPDFVRVVLKSDRPVSYAPAFTNPVDDSSVVEGARRLVDAQADAESMYGLGNEGEWTMATREIRESLPEGDYSSLPALLEGARGAVEQQLAV